MKKGKNQKPVCPAPLFVAAVVLFYELLIHIWITDTLVPGRIAAVALFALGFGSLLGLITSLIPGKGQKWFAAVLAVVLVVLYLLEYFLNDAYQTFMTPLSLLGGATGVATDFADIVVTLLLSNLWRIGLFLLPILLYILLSGTRKSGWKLRTGMAAAAAAMYLLGFLTVHGFGVDAARLTTAYNFDSAIRSFGVNMALTLDAFGGNSEDAEPEFVVPETMPQETQPEESLPEETEAATEPPVVYGENVLPLDFAALAEAEPNGSVAKLHSYVQSLTPSMQNEYTGLFEGKNLIFITAEAFAAEVIDPELTPALYRLANEGIHFTEYYQPLWGGSTSTGEYSNLIGLVANNGSNSIKEAIQQDLFLTIGNQLQDLGYFSAAYHNHTYTYYSRNETHTKLGYDTFLGMGNGMEEGVVKQWPASDLEMMQFTLPQYIDQQPFSVYYMSVSGHCLYNQGGNHMSARNYDVVADLPASERIKCYIAANLELEYALQYLLEQLEAAGIADDTVIVLGTDHYPYGLENSSTWGNDKDYLAELYGYNYKNVMQRDHSALIIWSGSIEDADIQVDEPVYSLDILPTLSNLFGVEYDSRLLVGRDVFSNTMPLALWPDFSWKTELGFYDASTGKFTPAEGVTVEEDYVDYVSTLVKNKITYSHSVAKLDYFNYLAEALGLGE